MSATHVNKTDLLAPPVTETIQHRSLIVGDVLGVAGP